MIDFSIVEGRTTSSPSPVFGSSGFKMRKDFSFCNSFRLSENRWPLTWTLMFSLGDKNVMRRCSSLSTSHTYLYLVSETNMSATSLKGILHSSKNCWRETFLNGQHMRANFFKPMCFFKTSMKHCREKANSSSRSLMHFSLWFESVLNFLTEALEVNASRLWREHNSLRHWQNFHDLKTKWFNFSEKLNPI